MNKTVIYYNMQQKGEIMIYLLLNKINFSGTSKRDTIDLERLPCIMKKSKNFNYYISVVILVVLKFLVATSICVIIDL